MELIKKGTLFKRAEVEMSKEEYKAYMLGKFFGRVEGFVFGVIVTLFIGFLIVS